MSIIIAVTVPLDKTSEFLTISHQNRLTTSPRTAKRGGLIRPRLGGASARPFYGKRPKTSKWLLYKWESRIVFCIVKYLFL